MAFRRTLTIARFSGATNVQCDLHVVLMSFAVCKGVWAGSSGLDLETCRLHELLELFELMGSCVYHA